MESDKLNKLLAGDLDAYAEVVREYQPILFGYAAQRLPDWDTIHDVVQLTFVRAWQRIHEYDNTKNFGTWLCVICHYFIMSELERQRRDLRNKENYKNALEMVINQAYSNKESDENSRLPVLKNCMHQLSEKNQDLIQKRYHLQHSCQQIAEDLDRSVTWVTSNLSRVRKALKQCIESKMITEEHA